MKLKIKLFLLFSTQVFLNSQVRITSNNIFFAKDFSKEIALFEAKRFLFQNILGSTTEVVQFEIIPLAAASSGELTTLLYKCDNKQKEGMILGFYGNYWNDEGVLYQGYAFKNFEKEQAMDFLYKIQTAIENNSEFFYATNDYDNNILF